MSRKIVLHLVALAVIAPCAITTPLTAQTSSVPAGAPPAMRAPIISPEMNGTQVTFRLLAPGATNVSIGGAQLLDGLQDPSRISGGAQPGAQAPAGPPPPRGVPMTRGEGGVWSVTVGLKPGAWSYIFNVDGVGVIDPNNTNLSPSQRRVQNIVYVPGDFSETRDVPHGAVSIVHYTAKSLGNAQREMYIYTPPGYEKGEGKFPVLYLIHGGGETASNWSRDGRANDILDNLLAEKKAKPMIIVMPSGWTPKGGQVMTSDATKDPFNDEMMQDIIPYVESHYRVQADPDHRAISGLSMGGIQTLNVGLHNLGKFRYVVVMSSGWTTDADRSFFYEHEVDKVKRMNAELKLFWWGWGETDIARPNSIKVTDYLKSQGVKLQTMETPDGHVWMNWRLYLHEIAPKLFQ